jgi:hypothetical protein
MEFLLDWGGFNTAGPEKGLVLETIPEIQACLNDSTLRVKKKLRTRIAEKVGRRVYHFSFSGRNRA